MAEDDDQLKNDRQAFPGLWLTVQGANGNEFWHWSQAGLLSEIARRALNRTYFRSALTPAEEAQTLQALEVLHQRLARNSGFVRPRQAGGWEAVLAQLEQVMPLVARLLA